MKHTFPANYGDECIIVAFDKSLLPMIAGALRPFEKRYSWVSEEDYELGYNAFAQVQADMANNCLTQLIESNNRLYRLLDTSLNGTQYSAAVVDGETVISPALPDVPPASTDEGNALRAHVGRLWLLGENMAAGSTFAAGAGVEGSPALDDAEGVREVLRLMQGMTPGGWFGIGAQRATLADVAAALRMGTEADVEKVDTVLEVLQGASSGASIFDTLRSFVTDTAELGTEASTLGAIIAAAAAQAAMAGLQAATLDEIKTTLNLVHTALAALRPEGSTATVVGELVRVGDLLEPDEGV